MTGKSDGGIAIARKIFTDTWVFDELQYAHRDDYHLFLFQEEGRTEMKIDFQGYCLESGSIICIHPDQVHHLGPFFAGKVSFLLIDKENLLPEQLNLLEDIRPIKPLHLDDQSCALIADTVTLCLRLHEQTEKKMYHTLVKESCNLLVGLFISQYLAGTTSYDKLSRPEQITKAFRTILDQYFVSAKRPADYAQKLNISTPYLYECVKNATGFSVSYHIEQRVILEAKRLLYYSDRSVKQIAAELGFNDYPYFTRLFAKVTGMTALAFRKKNRD
ncbi:AraC family transcriptional regulator [Mucilaginibacter gynuensis]|uniref:AraC family transcriptional regulator n=1 Tax=Mucilaginibacter gynuensis TaxID=1302236 RepID=A0ABP8GFT7_9SPHI